MNQILGADASDSLEPWVQWVRPMQRLPVGCGPRLCFTLAGDSGDRLHEGPVHGGRDEVGECEGRFEGPPQPQ